MDEYDEIDRKLSQKRLTQHEDYFLTLFLDYGLYSVWDINAQISFRNKYGTWYRVDFLLFSKEDERKMIVEIDDSSHKHKKHLDAERDEFFKELGYETIRISNEYVEKYLQEHLEEYFNG